MSEQGTNDGASHGPPPRLKLAAALIALLVAVAALSALLLGGSSRTALPGGVQQKSPGEGFEGTLTLPRRAAPAIALRDYRGRPVTLAQYRGKAVLVTFLYANCPDVCPLIASNLRVALNLLGRRASEAQVIAVSVDPRGDTPREVARFLRAHEMTGRMQYLIGDASELARTWSAWNVGSRREAGQPDLVAHDALVYGVSASGKLTTIYPSSFQPQEIAHDVPRLAAG
jgi:protein SCO1/2